MDVTAFTIAQRFIGIREVKGPRSNPLILWALQLDGNGWVLDDETPWCSAFVKVPFWLLRLPRSKGLNARSWLGVGTPVPLEELRPEFDVVVLSRGGGRQPGPDVLDAPGHVGLFAGLDEKRVWLLGGNQGGAVSVAPFDRAHFLGGRRLAT